MTKIVCRKTSRGLVPVDSDGLEVIGKIRDGRDVMVEVRQSRNPRHHRLYWAVVKFISEHAPIFEGVPLERIHVALKIATDLVDTFIDSQSKKVFYVPRSIAFEAMDQTEFSTWFDDACRVVAERWLPAGTTAQSVRDELIALVDGPHAIGERVA